MALFRRSEVFEPPTRWERIFNSPIKFLISLCYRLGKSLRSGKRKTKAPIRVVCISDTHCLTCEVPDGDLLIHAGDMADNGTVAEIQAQIDWMAELPHQHKVAIAGNHDTFLDPRSRRSLSTEEQSETLDWRDIHYLQHSSITLSFSPLGEDSLRTLTVFGAPQIPQCGGSNFAFQYPRGQDAWSDTVPRDIDILVTHTPPKYHLDLFAPSLGCEHLLREAWDVRPLLHVCGHVHAGAGRETLHWDEMQTAYERAMAKKTGAFLGGLFNPWLWIDAVEVVLYGATGIVWDKIWGGEQRQTVLVNAALMFNNTGELGNEPQVVDI